MAEPETVLFRSFGREAAGTSDTYCPSTVDDVREVFKIAKDTGRRVAVRGGGHSFHDQALHNGDTGKQIVLCSDQFTGITPAPDGDPNTVLLGAGVKWIDYFQAAMAEAASTGGPLRLPGSMQTGRHATAGGTMSGDCLSRFSAVLGKESRWIKSFRMVTTEGDLLDVSPDTYPDLFYAAIGGHGYLGFVTDVTYRRMAIDARSCARTNITTYESFHDLVAAQLQLIRNATQGAGPFPARAISSVWFTDLTGIGRPDKIKGGVFDSCYAMPSNPPAAGFPLYGDIESDWRYVVELMARFELPNLLIHEFLYNLAKEHKGAFENDLMDFLFFMDGNTVAKNRFEKQFYPQLFPIVQQTFVTGADKAVAFAENCEIKMAERGLRPTETDMLFVAQDDCFISANYRLDGFAITIAFEPISPDGKVPQTICDLLHDLSVDCLAAGGRIHFVKNIYADPPILRQMFHPNIEAFEVIKRKYDRALLLQNPFSDRFFRF